MPLDPSRLPIPEPHALAASRELAARIRAEIELAGGWIGFDRYVELALYAPGLGYYSGGSVKLGAAGDFVTAPELGDALARAIAASVSPWLGGLAAPAILELGAGSGALAADLLDALAADGVELESYRILEVSAELEQRQRQALAGRAEDIRWLDRLPERPFDGLILANEVVDALPAACFVKQAGEVVPLGVECAAEGFAWAQGREQAALSRAVRALERELGAPLPEGYRSEVRLALPAWIDALARTLGRGAVLIIDYGYVRRDYYHPQRRAGTLLCHYRHRAHDDPFLYPGLEDISVWVDFSAVAEAAAEAGLAVAGFTTQAQLLLGALGERLAGPPGDALPPRALTALKTLVLPGEMGERFKALLLAKGVGGAGLPGRDFRSRL